MWEKSGTYHVYQVFADGIFSFWSIYSNNNNTWKNTANRLAIASGLLAPIRDYDIRKLQWQSQITASILRLTNIG